MRYSKTCDDYMGLTFLLIRDWVVREYYVLKYSGDIYFDAKKYKKY